MALAKLAQFQRELAAFERQQKTRRRNYRARDSSGENDEPAPRLSRAVVDTLQTILSLAQSASDSSETFQTVGAQH